jgi:PPOX class probable F420-dependent enzyme
MKNMTLTEIREFLLAGTRTGKAATVRKDGRPHVTPIWFDLDGDEVVFMTWHESVKAANLKRDPRLSLCIDEEHPPFSFVIMEGTVEITEDPPERKYWAARIGGRYMGEDQAEAYGKRNGVEGELVVRFTPTKIVAKKDVAL